MHASDLLEQSAAARKLRESLSHFTWYDTPALCGETVLRTSYWRKSGSVVREAFLDAQAMPAQERSTVLSCVPDPSSPFSETEQDWQKAARLLGFPQALPIAVDSILKVEAQRARVFPITVWDEKLGANMKHLMMQHGISRPGSQSPSLLVGPSGASKTHSALALYSALGIAVHLVEATPSTSDEVRTEILTGNRRPIEGDVRPYVAALAAKGCFQSAAGRYAYYRALVETANRQKCDLIDAHSRISADAWQTVATADGYSTTDGPQWVDFPGEVRLAGHGHQVTLVDEVNKFCMANLQELRNHLSSETRGGSINSVFVFTANPPTPEYARTELPADLLACCDRRLVSPRSLEEYRDFATGWLGRKPEQGELAETVEELIRQNNPRSPDRTVPTDVEALAGEQKLPVLGATLSDATVEELGNRLARLQIGLERESRPGGPLHPATYGIGLEPIRPSIRSFAAILKRFNDKLAFEMVHNGSSIHAGPAVLARALQETLQEKAIAPYSYERESPRPVQDSRATLNTIITDSGLDSSGIAAVFHDPESGHPPVGPPIPRLARTSRLPEPTGPRISHPSQTKQPDPSTTL